MSAPISIPVHIDTDEGTEALMKMAGGFDNVYAAGMKLNRMFGALSGPADRFQAQLAEQNKMFASLRGESDLYTKSLGGMADMYGTLTDATAGFTTASQRLTGGIGDLTTMLRLANIEQKTFLDQQLAITAAMGAAPAGRAADAFLAGGATRSVGADTTNFLRAGSMRVGPASFGGSALGIPVPVLAGAVAGYLGYNAMSAANQYNQSITDVVSQSTQNAGSIAGLQQGVLDLAGGQNRNTPQQLTQGLYPIASSPIFKNQADQINALRVVSMQSQGSGPNSIQPLASADVGAISAYGFTANQMQFVADTIQKGVNIGLAESPDFAKGVGTFSAASLAADPNRSRAFQQAVGAFAQQTNLSPRFRFDAQGENAFLQSINKPLTGQAGQVANALGISNLFGVGAEGNAGGMQNWFQQLQSATAGTNQQAYLQSLFGRQNALQFARGFTGSNYGSGQLAIGGTSDAFNTVLHGAQIADQGPQAKWDQIQSSFNKSVIEVGDTISKTLEPALLSLATTAGSVAASMGNGLGSIGGALDAFINGNNKSSSGQGINQGLGVAALGGALAGTAVLADSPLLLGGGLMLGGVGLAAAGLSAGVGALNGQSAGFTTPIVSGQQDRVLTMQYNQARNIAAMHGQAFPSYQAWPGGRAAGSVGNLSGALGSLGSGSSAGMMTSFGGGMMAGVGSTDFGALAGSADSPPARPAGFADPMQAYSSSAMIAFQRNQHQAGANALLGLGHAAAITESSSTEYSRRGEAQSSGYNAAALQRMTDAAQRQYDAATTFQTSVQLHQGTLAQSDRAAQQVYQTSLNLIRAEQNAGTITAADAAKLRMGSTQNLNSSLLSDLQGPMAEAQAAFSLAQLTGKGLPGARSTEADLYRRQAALGGIGPNQLALDLYQLGQQGQTSKFATPGPQLIRSAESGLGDAIAGANSTVARLSQRGGQDQMAETVRHLQLIIQRDEKIITELQKANDHLDTIQGNQEAVSAPRSGPSSGPSAPRRSFGF